MYFPSPVLRSLDLAMAEVTLLPAKALWSRRDAARYLGVHHETLQRYLDQICVRIPDFRQDIHRHPKTGELLKGFQLTEYQMWVLTRVVGFLRFLNKYLNGRKYFEDVKNFVFKYRHYFSRELYHQQIQLQPA